ncbi:MAG TPA: PQQ-binding-like beta-propeller repeat protein, partial [Pseudonocardiaceae bacterium]|nr:PQQ-binding-like beta-propeller repeat protein [Pseudonocardiaceae bacterium]
QNGVTGLDARTGRQRWAYPSPAGCVPGQVRAGHGAVVAVSYCAGSVRIADLDAAGGTVRWTRDVPQPTDGTAVAILSTDPVVLNEIGPAPRNTETLQVFGANGKPGPDIDVSEIDTPDGPVRLDTDRHAFDAAPTWWTFTDGAFLVGVTKDIAGHTWAVGYRLSDGRRQWLTPLATDALAVTERNGRMSVAYNDGPVPVIASLSVEDGSSTLVGVVPGDVFADESALADVPGGYVAVNTTGTNPHHPVVLLRN